MSRIKAHVDLGPLLAAIIFFCAACLTAQGQNTGSIRGKVVLPNGAPLNTAAAIRLETSRGVRNDAYTDNLGQFSFPSLAPGIYQVVVEADRTLFELVSTTVEVFPRTPAMLTIALKEKRAKDSSRKSGGTVSTGELDSQIPVPAKEEFDRGTTFTKEGKTEEAIAHLRKAVELYPGYLMARNDLGVQLLAQGKLDEAAVELRRATVIDPNAFNPWLNLGIVLVHQQGFPEAADILRRALSLEANSPSARLYLGKALSGLDDHDAAEVEFKAAHDLGGANYSLALYYLGHIYLNKGQRQRALEMFESYLSETPKAANEAEVRKLIEMLH
jgi:tetratricopeptide (TPR) repeat protein